MTSKWLIASDIDGTLVSHHKDSVEAAANLQRFRRYIEAHRDTVSLAYVTGRDYDSFCEVATLSRLPEALAAITSTGTEIRRFLDGQYVLDERWRAHLGENWSHARVLAVVQPYLDQHAGLFKLQETQSEFRLGCYCEAELAAELIPLIDRELAAAGLASNLVYSMKAYLDILPLRADKGLAVTFLREELGYVEDRTISCGDSGNDVGMFANAGGYRVAVGNAIPELTSFAEKHLPKFSK